MPEASVASRTHTQATQQSVEKGGVQVEWNNPEDPSRGFQYLYLSNADYQSIVERAEHLAVKCTLVSAKGELKILPRP